MGVEDGVFIEHGLGGDRCCSVLREPAVKGIAVAGRGGQFAQLTVTVGFGAVRGHAASVGVEGDGVIAGEKQREGDGLIIPFTVVVVGDLGGVAVHRQDISLDRAVLLTAYIFCFKTFGQGGKIKGSVFTQCDRIDVVVRGQRGHFGF